MTSMPQQGSRTVDAFRPWTWRTCSTRSTGLASCVNPTSRAWFSQVLGLEPLEQQLPPCRAGENPEQKESSTGWPAGALALRRGPPRVHLSETGSCRSHQLPSGHGGLPPSRWDRLRLPQGHTGLSRRLEKRPTRQEPPTAPHQVRVHPGEAPVPPSAQPFGRPVDGLLDTTSASHCWAPPSVPLALVSASF